jgi:hypothetical protein
MQLRDGSTFLLKTDGRSCFQELGGWAALLLP